MATDITWGEVIETTDITYSADWEDKYLWINTIYPWQLDLIWNFSNIKSDITWDESSIDSTMIWNDLEV